MKIRPWIVMVILFAGPAWASHDEIYKPIEARALVKDSGMATRQGDSLFLKLQNGKILTLQNSKACEQADNCWAYYYAGSFAQDQFYLIEKGLWEGGDTLLISRQSGEILSVHAEPQLSPDGKWIFSTTGGDEYSTSGAYLCEIHDGKLIERFTHEPKTQTLYFFERWLSNTIVLLREYNGDNTQCPIDRPFLVNPAKLERQGDKWNLQPEPDNGSCEDIY